MRADAGFLARLSVLLGLTVLQSCGKGEDPLLLPGFEQSRPGLTQISLESAGRRPLLTLDRVGSQWQAREYRGWPAADDRVQALLDALAQARIVERKTRRVDLHPRLGVEDVASPDASGLRLSWRGGDGETALVVGKPGPAGPGQYLRLEGSDQALLVDRGLLAERLPLAWLDRQLLDLPSSRIREVRVQPRTGTAFVVRMEGFGHALAEVPEALSEASACAALAGVLDRLEFEDMESDPVADTPAPAATEVAMIVPGARAAADGAADFIATFLVVDGRRVQVRGWRREARYWIALSLDLDEVAARDWIAQASEADAEARLKALRRETDALQARLQARRFLLDIERTAALVRSRPQYLRSSP